MGIAQFLPSTAKAYRFDPRDPEASIDGQAHFMRDLLRQFASVPLALAAYNAGPGGGLRLHPADSRDAGYVARILALLGGAGLDAGGGEMEVRLVA